jgi:hypothetical protein
VFVAAAVAVETWRATSLQDFSQDLQDSQDSQDFQSCADPPWRRGTPRLYGDRGVAGEPQCGVTTPGFLSCIPPCIIFSRYIPKFLTFAKKMLQ